MAKLPTYSQVNGVTEKSISLSALSGGIVLSDLPFKLGLNQSPDCKNVWFANNVLGKRMGQGYLTNEISTSPIIAATQRPWNNRIVYQAGTNLKTIDVSTLAVSTIYSQLSGTQSNGSFVPFGEYLYYLNGVNYIQISSSFTAVSPAPYIPVVLMNSAYSGGGDLLEDYNRLGAGFTVKFSGTTAHTNYQLPVSGLDATGVTVRLYGNARTDLNLITSDTGSGTSYWGLDYSVDDSRIVITGTPTDDLFLKLTGGIAITYETDVVAGWASEAFLPSGEYTMSCAVASGTSSSTVYPKLIALYADGSPTEFSIAEYSTMSAKLRTMENISAVYISIPKTITVSALTFDVRVRPYEEDGQVLTEGTDFTVDRTNGIVIFTDEIAAGTNLISVTAYKTDSEYVNSIKNCRYATTYGGENEVKIVVSGNPDYPNYFYASGTQDGTYFPDNLYNLAGSGEELITGFGKQYSILVIFKERSIWSGTYNVDGSEVRIPVTPINQNIGCDCPYTIQTVDNTLTWCNTYGGVYGLFSTTNDDERNVLRLSGNVNGTKYINGLLNETDLKVAISVDFDGRYYLCVNGKVYLWDYSLQSYTGDEKALSWWLFDNINLGALCVIDRELWYGSSTSERWVNFIESFKDFDSEINAHWWMAATDFGTTRYNKTVTSVVISSRGSTSTKATLKYRTDLGEWDDPTQLSAESFSLKQFSLNTFTLRVTRFAKSQIRRPGARHIMYFQIGFANSDVSRDLSIPGIDIHYYFEGDVK